VGEPINEEAWHWYNDHVGDKRCPVVDTWWQTETGGIMISPIPFVTPTKPTYATLPLPGIQPVLMDERRNEIEGNQVVGSLCINFHGQELQEPFGVIIKGIKKPIFCLPGKYFTGDGALRDEVGYYRITGRVDDVVIVLDTIWVPHLSKMLSMNIQPSQNQQLWAFRMILKEMLCMVCYP
jgi:acetyl-CoA synthetase